MTASHLTLVLGGGRSGKSRYAEALARQASPEAASRVYLATAEAFDEEMRLRIATHRRNRGDEFVTVEEPLDLAGALRNLPQGARVVLVDCVTVWLGNLLHHVTDPEERAAALADLLEALEDPPCPVVLVSNETGLGIIPGDPVSRAFRDLAGRLNQDLAARAERVVLMVAGIPVRVKGDLPSPESGARP